MKKKNVLSLEEGNKAAFTLAEGRVDEVHFNTWKTANDRQVQDHLVEAIQPIEKDVNRHKSTGTNFSNYLITQSPVLDLLHAHGDSPKERCSSRLVPFAIRTRYAVLLAGVKRVCNAAAFASPFRPLPARAPSVRKSAIPLFPSKKIIWGNKLYTTFTF